LSSNSEQNSSNCAQLAKCILLHAYSRTTASFQAALEQTKTLYRLLTSWHNRIFGYKLRTIEAEILKKLRTGSLNLELTDSYKKGNLFS